MIIYVRVDHDLDDAEEEVSSGDMYLNSTDLELGVEGNGWGPQYVGIRFDGVAIPTGATIIDATIEFEVDEPNTGAASVTIRGQDADNSGTFTNGNSNISNRPTTTATVSWNNIPSWPSVNANHQTPDLSTIVQEIVNRSGWISNNALVFVIDGTGERTAESHDGEPNAAPLLMVEYVAP